MILVFRVFDFVLFQSVKKFPIGTKCQKAWEACIQLCTEFHHGELKTNCSSSPKKLFLLPKKFLWKIISSNFSHFSHFQQWKPSLNTANHRTWFKGRGRMQKSRKKHNFQWKQKTKKICRREKGRGKKKLSMNNYKMDLSETLKSSASGLSKSQGHEGFISEKLYMLLQLYLQNKSWNNPSIELLQCFSELKDTNLMNPAYLQWVI